VRAVRRANATRLADAVGKGVGGVGPPSTRPPTPCGLIGRGSLRRSEMAPQRLEKIESGLGNCSIPEVSRAQDLVHGLVSDSAPRLTKRRGGSGATKLQKMAPNVLKLRDAEMKSPTPNRASSADPSNCLIKLPRPDWRDGQLLFAFP
jgi:hypothetical protein